MNKNDKAPESLTEAYIEEMKEIYMSGRCMFLAIALKRLFGYEMQACIETDNVGEYIAHAWVKMPNGNILDIDGEYPESMNAYNGEAFGRRENDLSEAAMKSYMTSTEGYEKDVREAMGVVRDYLLPTYNFSDKYRKKDPASEIEP